MGHTLWRYGLTGLENPDIFVGSRFVNIQTFKLVLWLMSVSQGDKEKPNTSLNDIQMPLVNSIYYVPFYTSLGDNVFDFACVR